MMQKNNIKYRDASISFEPHPVTGDISTVSNERDVMQSIRTLVLTDIYGRLFAGKHKAGGARELLFSIMTPMVVEQIKTRIEDVIENHEPRAILEDVEVTQPDHESLYVSIEFTTQTDTSKTVSFGFYLKRTL